MSELVTKQNSAPATVDPMQLLATAVSQGADIDKLEKLMALQERWEANNARKAFTEAMAKFKESPPKIVKDTRVRFSTNAGVTEYMHAKADQVTEKISSALSAVGISHRFEISQNDKAITVTCVLTHVSGHSERTPLSAGADSSGGKNSIQAIGSTVSYLQRYTLLAATGLATGEEDDDGTSADPIEFITDEQLSKLVDMIAATNSNTNKFCSVYKISALNLLPADKFDAAMKQLNAKLGKMKNAS